jgi:hypothetical protein
MPRPPPTAVVNPSVRTPRLPILVACAAVVVALVAASSALAAPALSVTPITWA